MTGLGFCTIQILILNHLSPNILEGGGRVPIKFPLLKRAGWSLPFLDFINLL